MQRFQPAPGGLIPGGTQVGAQRPCRRQVFRWWLGQKQCVAKEQRRNGQPQGDEPFFHGVLALSDSCRKRSRPCRVTVSRNSGAAGAAPYRIVSAVRATLAKTVL